MNDAVLTTHRLVMYPLSIDDADPLYLVYGDELAMRYWHEPVHPSPDTTRAVISESLKGPGVWWTIHVRSSTTTGGIGTIGYLGRERDGTPGMAYILRPDYWRQGYMTEAMNAVLTYGFNLLQLKGVELWIDADNLPSQRLAQRAGFRHRGRFVQHQSHRSWPHETLVYGLFDWEWQGSYSFPPDRPPGYGVQPVLPVADVEATARYYRDNLGFRVNFTVGSPPVHAVVSFGPWSADPVRIQFHRIEGPETSRLDPANSLIELYISVGHSIDFLHAKYRREGVPIVDPMNLRPWGDREFAIRDCNGYVLRFGSPAPPRRSH